MRASHPSLQGIRMTRLGVLADLHSAVLLQLAHVQCVTAVLENMVVFGAFDRHAAMRIEGAMGDLKLSSSDGSSNLSVRLTAASETVGWLSIQQLKWRCRREAVRWYAEAGENTTALPRSTQGGQSVRLQCAAVMALQPCVELEETCLRLQMAQLMAATREVLAAFPTTRQYYFMSGTPQRGAKNARSISATPNTFGATAEGVTGKEQQKQQQEPASKASLAAASTDGALQSSQAPANNTTTASAADDHSLLRVLSEDAQHLQNLW